MLLFFSGFLLSLSLCLDLGIVNVALLRSGLQRGFLPALLIGVGSSFGDLFYAVLSMVGISYLLEHRIVRWILWLGGSAVLLWMSWQMVREMRKPKEIDWQGDVPARSLWKDFVWGAGLALASPSAILWFATIGGSVIAASQGETQTSLVLFFAGFFCAGLVWSAVISYLAAKGGKLMGPGIIRGFSLASAVLFFYFACKVFYNGYHTLL
ncbi:LysE family transporter [Brevibacillus sp. SYP-B805]|uniref:LysE family translocator n=1 Tax=Brevibacillus sp. SYP-B805 TaxID=1578199 RepID=UPI0013ED9E01|nr:LysE family transporter [Brevibacillus sp. SYP-B805]NGQ97407.1 LysE family transporter [Brevibacillus sp. SYP-B805]